MCEPAACSTSLLRPGVITCDKTLCKCTKNYPGQGQLTSSEEKLPGCDVSFILKPFDPFAQVTCYTTETTNQLHAFEDVDNVSSTSSTRTVHRLKMEVEICTEDLQEQRPGVSMTSLIRWNIGKVVERNPHIDLKKALSICQAKLELEPLTGRYRLPRSLATDEASDERHICCALLAWQAKGEQSFNGLVELSKRIQNEKKIEQRIFCTGIAETTSNKGIFGKKVTQAYRCEQGGCVGYIGHHPVVPPDRDAASTSQPLAATGSEKRFYQGLAGPVIKLPESCLCSDKKEPPPELKNEGCKRSGGIENLDIPSCLEGRCMERLRTLDKGLAALRERAARLVKREGERAKLLQRAEKAWTDMEQGFLDQLQLSAEEEEDIADRMSKLMNERNEFKCQCVQDGSDLDDRKELSLTAHGRLTASTEFARAAELERTNLEKSWKQANKDVTAKRNQLAKFRREIMYSEEQLRQNEKSLKDELASQRLQSRDVARTIKAELEGLRDQFNKVADQLLDVDDENKIMKGKLAQLKAKKASILTSLESCRNSCDAAYNTIQNELNAKNKAVDAAKNSANDCSCKLPKEACSQLKRSPSFAAVCRCTNRAVEKNCSCTSLRTRMMSDLLRDLFTGLKEEMVEGSAKMSCELLKCLDEDHSWDKSSPVKEKLILFFTKLVKNELDLAITTSIEHYHARWISESCVDKGRSTVKLKHSCVVLMAEPLLLSQQPSAKVEGDEGLAVADGESAWRRTQAEVCELSVQLQQLKRETVKRRHLKMMERNLANIVQSAAKPQRSIQTETCDLQPSEVLESQISNETSNPVNIPMQDLKHMKIASSPKNPIIKLKSSLPSTKLSPTKYFKEIPKEMLQINTTQTNTIENRMYVPSLTSADLYISPRNGSPRKQISSQYSNLINSVSLECDSSLNPVERPAPANNIVAKSVKNLFTVARSKKLHKAMINKKEYPCTSYNQCSRMNIEVKSPIRRMPNSQIGTETLNIRNNTTSCSGQLTQETDPRMSTYNELVSECMRSYTMENMLLQPNERTWITSDNEYINHENDKIIYKENEAIVNLLSMRTSDGTNHTCASLASWKTAQSEVEDITSIEESVYFSNNSIGISKDLEIFNTRIRESSGKIGHSLKNNDIENKKKSKVLFRSKNLVKRESEIESIIDFVEENEYSNDMIRTNKSGDTARKCLTGVASKIYRSMTSLFVALRAECHCDGEVGPYTEKIREQNLKLKRESEERSKLTSRAANRETINECDGNQSTATKSKRPRRDSRGQSRKSVSSLNSSFVSSSKSKYHKNCLVETPNKSAICKKLPKEQFEKYGCKKTQKKSTQYDRRNTGDIEIHPRVDAATTPKNSKLNKRSEAINTQTSSLKSRSKDVHICDCKRCQCSSTQKPNKQFVINEKIPKKNDVEKVCVKPKNVQQSHNFTPCFCDFKSLGAMLIRNQNACDVFGGDRLGIGPFRGIFANDQQPMGEPAAYGLDCKLEVDKNLNDRNMLNENTSESDKAKKSASLSSSQMEKEIQQKEQPSNLDDGIAQNAQSNLIAEIENECICTASATIQTNGAMKSNTASVHECACCLTEDKEKNNNQMSDLGVNAFHLLEKYIQCKIKKLKCACSPQDDKLLNEEAVYSAMLDKIQGLISTDIARLACHCREQFETENNEKMAFSLLEEYIRTKIDEIKCNCVGSTATVSQDLCALTLASIKDVINNDLADLTCCCKSMQNKESELPITQSRGVSGQKFVEKVDACCCCDMPSRKKNISSIGISTSKQTSGNLESGIQKPEQNKVSVSDLIKEISCKCSKSNNEEQKLKNDIKPSLSGKDKKEDLKFDDESVLPRIASKHSKNEEFGKSVIGQNFDEKVDSVYSYDISKRPSENAPSVRISTAKQNETSVGISTGKQNETSVGISNGKQNENRVGISTGKQNENNEENKISSDNLKSGRQIPEFPDNKVSTKDKIEEIYCRCSAIKNQQQKLKNASQEMLNNISKRNMPRCCGNKKSMNTNESMHSEIRESDSMSEAPYVGITLGVPCTCSSAVKNGHSKQTLEPDKNLAEFTQSFNQASAILSSLTANTPGRSARAPYIGLTLGCTCSVNAKPCPCSNKEDNANSMLKHEKSLVKFDEANSSTFTSPSCNCSNKPNERTSLMLDNGKIGNGESKRRCSVCGKNKEVTSNTYCMCKKTSTNLNKPPESIKFCNSCKP